jgi:lipopolysaccharide biosynthesis regulator YciM
VGWLGLFSGKSASAGSASPQAPDPVAARARQRRSGGRAQVDRELRGALLAVLDQDFDSAERAIANAARVDSDAIDAYLALARLYRVRGELGRSIRIHQNLLLRPDLSRDERSSALFELARDFHAGGFSARAIACYEEVLSQDKKNSAALAGLSELLADAGDFRRALQMRRRLAKLVADPNADAAEAALLLRMARAEHEEGRSDSARKLLKKAAKRDPQCAEAFALLGEIEAERGKSKAALAAWSAAATLGGPVADSVHPKLEATFAALGRAQDYEGFLRELLESQPEEAAARLALSRTLAARGETDSAISELRALLDRQPNSVDARTALGRLLIAEHREPDALKEFSELLGVLESQRHPVPPEPLE